MHKAKTPLCDDDLHLQASAAEVHSQPQRYPPGPSVHSAGAQQPTQPFVFAPHRLTPLSSQPPSYYHQHTHLYQAAPHQHSLSRTLSAEAESPAESQVYSLRSRVAPRVPTEPSCPERTQDGLQRPVHKVHHFFMCHTDQVLPSFLCFSNSVLCSSQARQFCHVSQADCMCTVSLQKVIQY